MVFSGAGILQADVGGAAEVRLGSRTLTEDRLDQLVEAEMRARSEELGADAAEDPEARSQLGRQLRLNFAARFAALELVQENGLWPTDDELIGEIKLIEDFQVDGRFSRERFVALIGDEQEYVRQTAEQLALRRFSRSVASSGLIDEDFVHDAAAYVSEQRSVRKLALSLEDFTEGIEASEQDLLDHHDQNSYVYIIPQRVRLEVADIRRADMEDLVEIDETRLRELYRLRNEEAKRNEERQLQLIVVADEQQAQELAESARADPKGFGELARANSEDAATSDAGGDLGFFLHEDLPFEVASPVFEAAVGSIVGPIEVDGSWQLYRVAGKIGGTQLDYDATRDDLITQLRLEQSRIIFEENAAILADQAFSLATGLEPLKESNIPFELETTDWIYEREYGDYTNPEGYQDQQLLDELINFANAQTGTNSELITSNLGERYLIVRVIANEPRRIKELDEVREEVREAVVEQKAGEAAAAHASAMIEQLIESGLDGSAEGFSYASTVLSQDAEEPPEGYSHADIAAAFGELQAGEGLPAYAIAYDPEAKSLNVLAVDEIVSSEPNEEQLDRIEQSVSFGHARVAESMLLNELIADYDVFLRSGTEN